MLPTARAQPPPPPSGPITTASNATYRQPPMPPTAASPLLPPSPKHHSRTTTLPRTRVLLGTQALESAPVNYLSLGSRRQSERKGEDQPPPYGGCPHMHACMQCHTSACMQCHTSTLGGLTVLASGAPCRCLLQQGAQGVRERVPALRAHPGWLGLGLVSGLGSGSGMGSGVRVGVRVGVRPA